MVFKNSIAAITFFLCFQSVFSQVGINTVSPQAQLEITSSNQAVPKNTDGILIPKMDIFPAVNPTAAQNGMLAFLTTTIGTKSSGFYYWDNATTSWISIGTKSNWSLNGNVGTTASNFIGTTDDIDVSFKRKNIIAGKLELSNTSFGVAALNPISTGYGNTAIGVNTLSSNTDGYHNTATGNYALYSNTLGIQNTAIGDYSVNNNTTGNNNTGLGFSALSNNKANDNTAVGSWSMKENSTGTKNTALGFNSLNKNNSNDNTAIGSHSMYDNTSGYGNTAVGSFSMRFNTTGIYNCLLGGYALMENTSGSANTVAGTYAMRYNIDGDDNSANGAYSLFSNVSGSGNTALGRSALAGNLTGNQNTSLGYFAGDGSTSGSNNIAIGAYSDVPSPTASNQLSIANVIYGTSLTSAFDGKIGIGTTAPAVKLHVYKSASGLTPNPFATAVIEGTGNNYLNFLSAAGQQSGILFGVNGNATNGGILYNSGLTDGMVFRTNNNTTQMAITSVGYVGIKTITPTSELEVNGFTKQGSDAPGVKQIKLTGTTGSAQGNTISITHGLTSSKILAVSVLVEYSSGNSISNGYNGASGYEFDYYISPTSISVVNKSGNSASILSKPIRVLVTYEQ